MIEGKCSEFGGKDDEGMFKDTGLAVYEPHEADRRPDIFYEEDPKWIEEHPEWAKANPGERQPTWARLRTYFYYIALKYDKTINRKVWQNTPQGVKRRQQDVGSIERSPRNDCPPQTLAFGLSKANEISLSTAPSSTTVSGFSSKT